MSCWVSRKSTSSLCEFSFKFPSTIARSITNSNTFCSSSNFTVKLRVVVVTLEFDPSSLLIANELSPVAINLLPAPQQTLWLYNPYSSIIKLKLISGSAQLALANDDVAVRSHQHTPLLLTFSPNYVGRHEVNRPLIRLQQKASS